MLRACRIVGCPRIIRVGDTHVMQKTYTQEDVRLYASLIGDLNPIHQNIEAAKKAGFKNCVVHGMLVASLFSTSMGMYLPGPQSVYLHQAVDFTAPVIVGDPLEITVRVREFHKSRSLILLETTVEKPKEGGGKIVCVKGQGLGMNKAVTLEDLVEISATMMRIQFDLEPKIEASILKSRANAAIKHIHQSLLHTNSQDDFAAFQKLKSLCKREDYFDSGSITLEQLGNVLVQCGINENIQVVRAIFNDFDLKGEKKVDIITLCEGVFGRRVIPKKVPGVEELLDRVRNAVLARGIKTMNRLSSSFRIMDDDRSFSLSPDELFTGLKDYGVDLSSEDCAKVVGAFDTNGDGCIDMTEFLVALRGNMNDRREELVALAFKQLDKRGKGVVKFSELCKIYDASKHPEVKAGQASEEDIVLQFISSWDRNGDGDITLQEFVEYYKTLSCSIDNDEYFELMIRNAWHLAGGKGAAANTSNLRVLIVHSDDSEEVVCVNSDLGLDKTDADAVRSALEQQGVTDIKAIKLCM